MNHYQEAVEKLFGKYEEPMIEDITLGFSGIDPQRKYNGVDDHEILTNLLGGNDDGHYHLTLEELEWLREQMKEKFPPLITENQSITLFDSENMPDYEVLGENVKIGA